MRFIELPVFPDLCTNTSRHDTHSVWIRPEQIEKIEAYEWKAQPNPMRADDRDPSERPKICLVKIHGDLMFVALTDKEMVKLASDAIDEIDTKKAKK